MPANTNPKREQCFELIEALAGQLGQPPNLNRNSDAYKAVKRVSDACSEIMVSLDSVTKHSMIGQGYQAGKQVWREKFLPWMGEPTDDQSYDQIIELLNVLNPTIKMFNNSKTSDPVYQKNITKIGAMSEKLLGHPNRKFQQLGGCLVFMGVVLIVAALLAAPATFGLSLAIPATVAFVASLMAPVPLVTSVIGSATAAGGVYVGINNLRKTGLDKAVSDLMALESIKPKPKPKP